MILHQVAGLLLLAACLLAPLVARAHRRWRDRPDPAWRPSKLTRTFSGHDETKAPAAALRAKAEDDARLRLAVKRAGQTRSKKSADVYVMPKRGAR